MTRYPFNLSFRITLNLGAWRFQQVFDRQLRPTLLRTSRGSPSFSAITAMSNGKKNGGPKRIGRWYYGGLASAAAACITHPLDLLKVHLQTQQSGKMGLVGMGVKVVKSDGVLALYNGLSASLLRQFTYSLVRFGMYEQGKQMMTVDGQTPSFMTRMGIATVSGAVGGFCGVPGDLVNVRMQNDVKLPPERRRNYKHAIDGVVRILREEGLQRLFSGASLATSRAVLMTIGQLGSYDQFKIMLLSTPYFEDNTTTHFTASTLSGGVATTMTQPLDVLKTRAMNAKPGEFQSLLDIVRYTAQAGPSAFFKGYVPAFVRLAPHTILTFIFMEKLRENFGKIVE